MHQFQKARDREKSIRQKPNARSQTHHHCRLLHTQVAGSTAFCSIHLHRHVIGRPIDLEVAGVLLLSELGRMRSAIYFDAGASIPGRSADGGTCKKAMQRSINIVLGRGSRSRTEVRRAPALLSSASGGCP